MIYLKVPRLLNLLLFLSVFCKLLNAENEIFLFIYSVRRAVYFADPWTVLPQAVLPLPSTPHPATPLLEL
jgi:hypothetical protein